MYFLRISQAIPTKPHVIVHILSLDLSPELVRAAEQTGLEATEVCPHLLLPPQTGCPCSFSPLTSACQHLPSYPQGHSFPVLLGWRSLLIGGTTGPGSLE